MAVRLSYTFKRVDRRNPISGHCWAEFKPLKQVEVVSNGIRSVFNSEKAANKFKEEQEAFFKKFPFVMPRTERELKKAKRLGLS
jgi:hypothetical protein